MLVYEGNRSVQIAALEKCAATRKKTCSIFLFVVGVAISDTVVLVLVVRSVVGHGRGIEGPKNP